MGNLTLSLAPPNLIAPPKDVLTLTYVGKNDDPGDLYGFQPFSGTLTVEGGTGKFQGAQGTISYIAAGAPSVVATEFGATTNPVSATGNAFYLLEGAIINQGSQ